MPAVSFKASKTAPTAGNGSSKQLVAASSGNSIVLWKVVLAATVTDPLIFQDGSGGTTLLTVQVPANTSIVLPYDGCPLLQTTAGNGLFFNGLATTTVTAYYSIP
jgi:hypothetical protein